MGVPKSKRSRMRAKRTRAHLKVIPPNLEVCPQCGALKEHHKVCLECGYYRGLKLIKSAQEIREEKEKRRKEKREAEEKKEEKQAEKQETKK
jgi:large subunit ribosomal protein L32